MESQDRRLAVMLSFSGQGGVERMMMNLVEGFAARGCRVDLLALGAPGAVLNRLPAGVTCVDLGIRHSTLAVPALTRYLRRHRPGALLVAKDRAIRSAVLAHRVAGVDTRLVGRLGTNLTAALDGGSPAVRLLRRLPMRRLYARVDRLVAVSEGVAEDVRRITGLPASRVTVIRNPVVTAELPVRAAEPVVHPWLGGTDVPVILGAGRLTRQKDFPTLIRAFARLRRERPARLVILGEGSDRRALVALSAELGIGEDVDLVGYVANPYAWMAKVELFVLSSIWEGSPNVLTEAMACGTPAVATDCPSGPRELFADGRYGPLVPVGDAAAMAAAMGRVLDSPPPAGMLREAVREYSVDVSAGRYLKVLRL
ncbi:MAG: glycosyltransferase [Nitrococcus mobilis]|nr:glycosyltransferase [Nitrococcus mobilis]